MASFRTTQNVAFADTDMAGVVHFSRLLTYVENAEHAWLQSLGFDLIESHAWPRVHIESNFQGPLRFPGEATIELETEQVGTSSLSYRFIVSNSQGTLATGRVTVARRRSSQEKAPFSEAEKAQLI